MAVLEIFLASTRYTASIENVPQEKKEPRDQFKKKRTDSGVNVVADKFRPAVRFPKVPGGMCLPSNQKSASSSPCSGPRVMPP
jgi:hypothetical protein